MMKDFLILEANIFQEVYVDLISPWDVTTIPLLFQGKELFRKYRHSPSLTKQQDGQSSSPSRTRLAATLLFFLAANGLS
jgi:hypothetical protein